MKNLYRIISVLLVLLLAFPCVSIAESAIDPYTQLIDTCLAEGMTIEEIAATSHQASADVLSDYSDNYLKVLIAIMQIELRNRGFSTKSVVVPMGEYIVGVDIPAGTYTVTTGDSYCSLEVFSSAGKKIHDFDSFDSEIIGKLVLKDGQTVLVEYDSVVFEPYKGLGF